MSTKSISAEIITNKIFIIRGQKVMIDRDLAQMFGVETKHLNRQVKRNLKRFPSEFMFQLTESEKKEVVTNWHHLKVIKFSHTRPYVFTEHGVAMLATILNSTTAIAISINIIKVFIKLRETLSLHKELAAKLKELEQKVEKHDGAIHAVFEAIRQLMKEDEKPKPGIGFYVR